jgi:hypothetical protein
MDYKIPLHRAGKEDKLPLALANGKAASNDRALAQGFSWKYFYSVKKTLG